MGLAFESGTWGWRLFRASRCLAELAQIDVVGEVEEPCGELLYACLCERGPFVFGDGDVETGHGGGDLASDVVLRDALVDRLGRMGGAQCRHDHGIEIESHQCQAEREQGGLRVAQGLDLGVEVTFELLKGGLDIPSLTPL